jgi:hypothetical protein
MYARAKPHPDPRTLLQTIGDRKCLITPDFAVKRSRLGPGKLGRGNNFYGPPDLDQCYKRRVFVCARVCGAVFAVVGPLRPLRRFARKVRGP